MHVLQPKHSRLKESEADALLKNLNISLKQLPKIKISDLALPEGAKAGDVIRIERDEEGLKTEFYRAVIQD